MGDACASHCDDGRASACCDGAAGLSRSSKDIFGNARVSPPVGAGSFHGDAGSGAGLFRSSKLIFGNAFVSPLAAAGGANGVSVDDSPVNADIDPENTLSCDWNVPVEN